MSDGFTSQSSTFFIAYIEGCTRQYVSKNDMNNYNETKNTKSNIEVQIYPNPNNGKFTINLSQLEEGSIEISNLYGVTVQKSIFKNQELFEVNMQDKPQGIYLITVKSNNTTYTNKVIKK